jgi:hypothetical protein
MKIFRARKMKSRSEIVENSVAVGKWPGEATAKSLA